MRFMTGHAYDFLIWFAITILVIQGQAWIGKFLGAGKSRPLKSYINRMIIFADEFCLGGTAGVVTPGTQLGEKILVAGGWSAPKPRSGRIMGHVTGAARARNPGRESQYVGFIRCGYFKIVVGSDELFIVNMAFDTKSR